MVKTKNTTIKDGRGLVPVPNRNYLRIEAQNEQERCLIEEKLNLRQQLVELSVRAAQKWAENPGTEACDTITVRCYGYGTAYIGVVFTVSASGNEFDGYAAYILPTKEDGDILSADWKEIAEGSGFNHTGTIRK